MQASSGTECKSATRSFCVPPQKPADAGFLLSATNALRASANAVSRNLIRPLRPLRLQPSDPASQLQLCRGGAALVGVAQSLFVFVVETIVPHAVQKGLLGVRAGWRREALKGAPQ